MNEHENKRVVEQEKIKELLNKKKYNVETICTSRELKNVLVHEYKRGLRWLLYSIGF